MSSLNYFRYTIAEHVAIGDYLDGGTIDRTRSAVLEMLAGDILTTNFLINWMAIQQLLENEMFKFEGGLGEMEYGCYDNEAAINAESNHLKCDDRNCQSPDPNVDSSIYISGAHASDYSADDVNMETNAGTCEDDCGDTSNPFDTDSVRDGFLLQDPDTVMQMISNAHTDPHIMNACAKFSQFELGACTIVMTAVGETVGELPGAKAVLQEFVTEYANAVHEAVALHSDQMKMDKMILYVGNIPIWVVVRQIWQNSTQIH